MEVTGVNRASQLVAMGVNHAKTIAKSRVNGEHQGKRDDVIVDLVARRTGKGASSNA